MQRVNDTLYNLFNTKTGEWETFNKITTYFDGTAMSDGKCDGVVYRKSGTEYFKKNITGYVNAGWFGIVGDGTDQTAKFNTLLAFAHIQKTGVILSSYERPNVTISGTVSNPNNVKIKFINGCKLVGTGTLDGGLIECGVNEQCFGTALTVKNLINRDISTIWFGVKADYVSPIYGGSVGYTDNTPLIQKAIGAARAYQDPTTIYNYSVNVYTPAPFAANYGYYCGSMISINALINFYGDGIDRTTFFFPAALGTPAIQVVYPFGVTKGARPGLELHHFSISTPSGGCTTAYDGASHGIYFTTTGSKIERVSVSGFNGDGIFVIGNAPASNVNNSRVSDCRSQINGGNGILIDGSDANNVLIDGGEYNYNARWGVYESSFLGCTMIGVHTATNGRANIFNRSAVAWNGTGTGTVGWKEYDCIKPNGPGTAAGVIEPGVTAGWQQYWTFFRDIPTAPFYGADLPNLDTDNVKKWNNTTVWVGAGGYYMDDVNNLGGAFGCYVEQDQVPGVNLGNGVIVGGFLAHSGLSGSITSYGQAITVNEIQTTAPQLLGAAHWNSFKTKNYPDGVYWGHLDNTSGVAGGFFGHNDGTVSFGSNIDGADNGNNVMRLHTPGCTYPNVFGTVNRPTVALVMQKGLYFARDQDIGNCRYFGIGTDAPSSGEYAEGSYVINVGLNKPRIIGWRCTAAGGSGSPGTWIPIYRETAPPQTLTDAAHVLTDAATGFTFRLPLSGNHTIDAPTNLFDGQSITYEIQQDTTGGRTITWDPIFDFGDAGAPTLSTAPSLVDIVKFKYHGGLSRLLFLGAATGYGVPLP